MHNQRISTINTVFLIVLPFFSLLLSAAAIAAPPNIVLILADDVGREVLECYGGSSYQTPRINELASQGTRFTHAYVMPTCHPTRTTLLSGQYPFRLGHPEWGTFPQQVCERTLAQLLKRAGYASAIAGKWQLSMLKDNVDRPHELGFDEYCLFGWHEGPRYYQPLIWQNGRLRDDVDNRYGPDVYVEYLEEFMRRNRDRPFFAFYSMALCHDVTDDLAEPVPFGPRGRYDSFAEMVAAMDERVGKIVDVVDELGLQDRTLVVYIADNGTPARSILSARDGQYIHEPNVSQFAGRSVPGGKAQLTDWGTRVPMIARWPGKVPEDAVSDTLLDASDFLPTLVELAGAGLPVDVHLDGHSFADALFGRQGSERACVFAEHKGEYYVKDRRWKLFNDGRFYDLSESPDESDPLRVNELSGDAATAHQRLATALRDLGITPSAE